ncbi:F-box family protein [Dorcoceras hygrometricum]|uniref:F-box family protein n=1 Tax=Dorcoceras hygrometricum TaxID=472368 RepID=A0A2Z7ANQ9_9LAMI|nr:F-box family protein [Dorcoceras hygrometricum]
MVAAGSRHAIVRVIEETTRVWFEEPVADEKRRRLVKWKRYVLGIASGTSSEGFVALFIQSRDLRFWTASAVVEDIRCVVPEKSNAIIGVVTIEFEGLPSSYDGLTGPDDHGPMISTG